MLTFTEYCKSRDTIINELFEKPTDEHNLIKVEEDDYSIDLGLSPEGIKLIHDETIPAIRKFDMIGNNFGAILQKYKQTEKAIYVYPLEGDIKSNIKYYPEPREVKDRYGYTTKVHERPGMQFSRGHGDIGGGLRGHNAINFSLIKIANIYGFVYDKSYRVFLSPMAQKKQGSLDPSYSNKESGYRTRRSNVEDWNKLDRLRNTRNPQNP